MEAPRGIKNISPEKFIYVSNSKIICTKRVTWNQQRQLRAMKLESFIKKTFSTTIICIFLSFCESNKKDSSSSIVIRKMKLIRFHIFFFFRSKVSEEAIFCRFRLPSTQVGNLLREQHFLVWLNWNCNSISCEKLVAASLPLRNSQFSIIVSYLVADTL